MADEAGVEGSGPAVISEGGASVGTAPAGGGVFTVDDSVGRSGSVFGDLDAPLPRVVGVVPWFT